MRACRAIGDKFLKLAGEQNKPVIVLAGRPYHIDPEINHGIDGLICDCGAVVVTEDAVSAKVEKFPTGVLNQWTYHSRLYAAAKYVVGQNDRRVNLIQLVSFGCGVDAITTDEVRSILHDGGRIYTSSRSTKSRTSARCASACAACSPHSTCCKPGAGKAPRGARPQIPKKRIGFCCAKAAVINMDAAKRVEFTKEMKKDYTILAPNMLPIHFKLFENLFKAYGYNVEIPWTRGRQIVDEGLKYVHNDTCYPALLTIGQMMDALHSRKYDLNKTALIITQTGGGCRLKLHPSAAQGARKGRPLISRSFR